MNEDHGGEADGRRRREIQALRWILTVCQVLFDLLRHGRASVRADEQHGRHHGWLVAKVHRDASLDAPNLFTAS
jgi:hypothetical protein